MTSNPYKFMLLKFQPHRVYGWEKEITSILQVVTAPEPVSHAIYGIRAVGKSTLLRFLKHKHGAVRRYHYLLDDDFRRGRRRLMWVYVNCHHIYDDGNILQVMYAHLADEMREQHIALHLLDDDLPQTNNKREMAAHLRQLIGQLNETERARVIFLLDDFDIPLLSRQITREDDYLLRTVSDFASLIIATDEPISTLRPDITKSSPLLGILNPERIGLIDSDAARRLICEPAKQDAKVEYSEAEVEMLLEVGGRLPYLLTMTCEKYFDLRQGILNFDTNIDPASLRQSVRPQLTNSLLLEPGVQSVLNLIWAKHDELHAILTEMAKAEHSVFTGMQAQRAQQHSLAYQSIDDQGNIGFRIVGSLFAAFVRGETDVAPTHNGAYDSSLVKVIGSLSPVDRGVLEYLAARAGEVCTFEELLNSVWEDGTGTKRALEAAVHRLRRTVPTGHEIRNVRGAGYKYIVADEAKV